MGRTGTSPQNSSHFSSPILLKKQYPVKCFFFHGSRFAETLLEKRRPAACQIPQKGNFPFQKIPRSDRNVASPKGLPEKNAKTEPRTRKKKRRIKRRNPPKKRCAGNSAFSEPRLRERRGRRSEARVRSRGRGAFFPIGRKASRRERRDSGTSQEKLRIRRTRYARRD